MDYVDLYLLHRDDISRPVSDIMDTLHILVQLGIARAIGVSNWSVKRIMEANQYARDNNKTQLSVSEIQWSLAKCSPKTFGDETLICMTIKEYEKYIEIGIPVIAYSSQANGVFTKAGEGDLEQVPDKLKKFVTPENIRRYSNLEQICKKTGYSKTAVSLGYILYNKINAAAIIGCTKMDQLEDSLSTTNITLSQHEINALISGNIRD
jgi:aryl-alcohol dehydrogenase-like predicted oxidoreductase